MPKKFPCLYNIIKKDDVSTLTDFFIENPGYNEENHLSIGSGLKLLEQAIESRSIQCAFFLINRIQLNQLDNYVNYVINSLKLGSEIFDYFYNIVNMHSKQQNNFNVLIHIVFKLIETNQKISEDLMTKIINDFDFHTQILNDDVRVRLERIIIQHKSSWIIYFEKYYREHNINLNYLFSKVLLFSRNDPNKFLKIFKNMDLTQKIHIENYYSNNFRSNHQYSLEFIILITCDIKEKDFKKFNIIKENTFEDELFNLFSEKDENFYAFQYSNYNNMFQDFMENIKTEVISYYTSCLIKNKFHERLLKIIPFISIRFMEFMREKLSFQDFDLNKFKRNYYSEPEFVENSRTLLKKMIEQFDKIHNQNN